ncbi:MAG: hypothetical protein ACI4V3_07350 [Faecousia sp.]
MTQKETNCPCCENHCPQEYLQCAKGMEYFGTAPTEPSPRTTEERVLRLLRKCGHYLHHSAGCDADSATLLSALSEEEKELLAALLSRCVQSRQ